ncbi:MAG: hypothetical protein M3116_06680, partial [Actinomycetota bacterium]|nr:hypothetical protein [Actinomycetota bacterium]
RPESALTVALGEQRRQERDMGRQAGRRRRGSVQVVERAKDDSGSGDPAAARPAGEESQAARAEAAIRAVAAGADPAAEALTLSNRFTDDFTARLRTVFRRRKRSSREPEGSE